MEVRRAVTKKKAENGTAESVDVAPSKPRKRGRWDLQQTPDESSRKKSAWDDAASTPGKSHWDETPGRKEGETPGGAVTPSTRMWDATPGATTPGHATPATPGKRNRWDMTPKWGDTPKAEGLGGETPGHVGWAETPRAERSGDAVTDTPGTVGKRRSRWDETPQSQRLGGGTPSMTSGTPSLGGATPSFGMATPNYSWQTPAGAKAMAMMTPSSSGFSGSMTPEQMQAWRWEKEMDDRNRPMSDDELDAIFPQDGYKVGWWGYEDKILILCSREQ